MGDVGAGRGILFHRVLPARRTGCHYGRALTRIRADGGGTRQSLRVLFLQLCRDANPDRLAGGPLRSACIADCWRCHCRYWHGGVRDGAGYVDCESGPPVDRGIGRCGFRLDVKTRQSLDAGASFRAGFGHGAGRRRIWRGDCGRAIADSGRRIWLARHHVGKCRRHHPAGRIHLVRFAGRPRFARLSKLRRAHTRIRTFHRRYGWA